MSLGLLLKGRPGFADRLSANGLHFTRRPLDLSSAHVGSAASYSKCWVVVDHLVLRI